MLFNKAVWAAQSGGSSAELSGPRASLRVHCMSPSSSVSCDLNLEAARHLETARRLETAKQLETMRHLEAMRRLETPRDHKSVEATGVSVNG